MQLWVARSRPAAPLAVGLIVGGVTANLVDRLVSGTVTDFIDIALGAPDRGVVLNPADVFLVAGTALLTAAALGAMRAGAPAQPAAAPDGATAQS